MKIEDIPVIRDFVDVFPEDILSLPLDREIKFATNLVPSTALVSAALNHMAWTKLKVLKVEF